eukprot:scaffold87669_cov60-Phaeocystis_antarctica.AAC.1
MARGVAVWLHHDVKFVQQSYAAPLEHHGRAMACVEAHLTGDAIPHLHGKLAQRSDLLQHLADVAVVLPHHCGPEAPSDAAQRSPGGTCD